MTKMISSGDPLDIDVDLDIDGHAPRWYLPKRKGKKIKKSSHRRNKSDNLSEDDSGHDDGDFGNQDFRVKDQDDISALTGLPIEAEPLDDLQNGLPIRQTLPCDYVDDHDDDSNIVMSRCPKKCNSGRRSSHALKK